MSKHLTSLGALACGIAAGGLLAQEGEQTAKLSFKAFKTFNFVMPKEVWTPVQGQIPIKHPGSEGFQAERDGLKLSVDTSGDGRLNKDVKGSSGYLKFRSKGPDGEKFQYAARFKGAKGGYSYSTSCAMVGTVSGVPIQLFDLNNNGVYNEVGTDAMIVGKGKAASYLSKVVSYKGELYNLEVSEHGASVTATPYDGDAGTLSLREGFKSRGKLEAAIVSDGNGNFFNLAGSKSGTKVPVGEYSVVAGLVTKGPQSARIRSGKMPNLRVENDRLCSLSWGGPVMAEFTHTLATGKVGVDPKDLKYYGKAGAEYYDFLPDAKSPKFLVTDKETGKSLRGFIFKGC